MFIHYQFLPLKSFPLYIFPRREVYFFSLSPPQYWNPRSSFVLFVLFFFYPFDMFPANPPPRYLSIIGGDYSSKEWRVLKLWDDVTLLCPICFVTPVISHQPFRKKIFFFSFENSWASQSCCMHIMRWFSIEFVMRDDFDCMNHDFSRLNTSW